VVVSDRYTDSSIAYQGAGRDLETGDIARISRWATDGLRPDLTVLLDLPPDVALQRVDVPDRLESEPLDFHERVRQHFLTLAAVDPTTYLVIDATLAPEQVASQLQDRLAPMLPLSPREVAEQEAAEAQRRAEEEERRRLEAEAAAAAAERARQEAAEAQERARRQAEEAAARKAAEAEERARRKAEERARREAQAQEERARREAQAEEERARREAEDRARREAEERARRQPAAPPDVAPQTTRPMPVDPNLDPPTRPLSLADELLGSGGPDDETIQLPIHKSRDDR
jgi:dTMP kinase